VGFVVEEVTLAQVFSEYFGFTCQFSLDRLLHIHHLSSGAGTIGQTVADVPSRLSLTPPEKTKKKNTIFTNGFSEINLKFVFWRFSKTSFIRIM
jgi:hypothetical protein